MEIESILTLISNYAFPIAMCVWLMISNQAAADRHRDEMQKVISALNNNTSAIQTLQDKVEWITKGRD